FRRLSAASEKHPPRPWRRPGIDALPRGTGPAPDGLPERWDLPSIRLDTPAAPPTGLLGLSGSRPAAGTAGSGLGVPLSPGWWWPAQSPTISRAPGSGQ